MACRVVPALVRVMRPIGSEGRGQRFAVDSDPVIPAASACELDTGRFAHHMHHVQGTLGLPRRRKEGAGCLVGGDQGHQKPTVGKKQNKKSQQKKKKIKTF